MRFTCKFDGETYYYEHRLGDEPDPTLAELILRMHRERTGRIWEIVDGKLVRNIREEERITNEISN